MDRLPDVMVDDHKLAGRCFKMPMAICAVMSGDPCS